MIMKTMGIVHTLIVFSLLARVRSRWKSRSIAPSRKIDSHQEIKYRAESSSFSLVLIIIANDRKAAESRAEFSFRFFFFFFRGHGRPGLRNEQIFLRLSDSYSSHEAGKFSTTWTTREETSRRSLNIITRHSFNDIRLEARDSLLLLYYIKTSSRSLSALRATPKKWNFFPAFCKVIVPRDVGFIESDFIEIAG